MLRTLTILVIVSPFFFSCGTSKESSSETVEVSTDNTINMSVIEEEHRPFMTGYADSVNKGLVEVDTFKGSARRETIASVGNSGIRVNYGSPGKRGRVIWNGLVSYDQVWVSGSHWATAVEFSKDVTVEGTKVPAGMYAFFTIPGREEWVLILNKNYDQHLADEYSESEDVVRVTVVPETPVNEVQRLTYKVTATSDTTGELALLWDDIKVAMPFSVGE